MTLSNEDAQALYDRRNQLVEQLVKARKLLETGEINLVQFLRLARETSDAMEAIEQLENPEGEPGSWVAV